MNKSFLQSIFFLISFIFFSGQLFGQDARGSIEGVIKDQQTGESLPGANIYISNLAIGTTTDIEGRFELRNIPIGTQQVEASFIGYDSQIISIEVTDGETQTVFL